MAEIQKLYRAERRAREESAPVLERIRERLERDACSAEILPSGTLGKAVSYTRGLWPLLERYAAEGNGEVDIDNNSVESERLAGAEMDCRRQPQRGPDAVGRHPDQSAIRPSAIGKKNWLFIGHPSAGQTTAAIYTIIENCRLEGIDPREYLEDVLPRIAAYPPERVAELLPRQWRQARESAAATPAVPTESAA